MLKRVEREKRIMYDEFKNYNTKGENNEKETFNRIDARNGDDTKFVFQCACSSKYLRWPGAGGRI